MWPFKRKIKTVAQLMAPLVKTRDKMKAAKGARAQAVIANTKRIEDLRLQNTLHEAESDLADAMIESLSTQLAPLDALQKPAEKSE